MPKRITFNSKSGTPIEGEIALPGGDMKAPGVVLIQEWWGINGHIRSILDRLASAGFIALAPDLYHGASTTEFAEAEALMKALNWDKALDEIGGAAAHLHAHERCIGRVGVTGFCLGGALAFATATHYPDLISAAVPFYGIPPEPARADFSKVRAPIMAHFASRDQWAKPELAQMIQAEVERAGQTMELHVYEADHAFYNDTRPDVYNIEAAKLAWKRSMDFLHKHLD
jgi:carboxymethylenebutenolidase